MPLWLTVVVAVIVIMLVLGVLVYLINKLNHA